MLISTVLCKSDDSVVMSPFDIGHTRLLIVHAFSMQNGVCIEDVLVLRYSLTLII